MTMSEATHPHGYRIAGPCHGARRYVDAQKAWSAYCSCDTKAAVDREGYLSAFQFDQGFVEHLSQTGSTRGFTGSTWSPFVWFDIDRDEADGGAERALADTRQLVNALDERHGVPRGVLVPFVSGGKGLHLGLPTALWLPPAGEHFHATAKHFALSIAAEAGITVDEAVYDRLRAFRAPNSRHPRTGLHKRFVLVEILDTVTVRGLLAMAARPEPFEVPVADGIDDSSFLVALWDKSARAVKEQTEAVRRHRDEIASGTRDATVNRRTRDFIGAVDEPADRHTRLFSAAANLAEIGCPLHAIRALLTERALDTGLPPREVERTITNGFDSMAGKGAA
jgi:hypothetical protein